MNNTNRHLLIQPPTEKWFLFTKNLAFKRIYEGRNCCLLDAKCNQKEVINVTHRARIVRREKYRSCQKFVAHFEVEEIIPICSKNRSKESVEEIFKDVIEDD
jgi:hypothetical protein